jgi:uncharacterized protein (DUF433 family)
MQKLADVISIQANVQFGKPVFKGTRVPVQGLFWHLEKGASLDAFLADFPSVSRDQAEAVIEWAARHFETPETVADETPLG